MLRANIVSAETLGLLDDRALDELGDDMRYTLVSHAVLPNATRESGALGLILFLAEFLIRRHDRNAGTAWKTAEEQRHMDAGCNRDGRNTIE